MNLRRNFALELMLILVVTFESGASYSEFEPRGERSAEKTDNKLDAGDPLYLTPLLDAGQADFARSKAKVTHPQLLDIESYAGYFTVNATAGSNLFFWYFPAKENSTTAPVVLYLEGGPGLTTLFGLSLLHGPFSVNGDLMVEPRKESWNNKQNVIYIDSPVGTGYSFTNSSDAYPKSQLDIAFELRKSLQQFFRLFPSLRKNDFFVAGESHAGKTVPILGLLITNENKRVAQDEKINLKGLAISSGFVDPINQLIYGEHFYKIGLVDADGRDQLLAWEKENQELIRQNKHMAAYDGVMKLFHGENSLFHNLTGYTNFFNILRTEERFDFACPLAWVQRPDVRRALHVGNKRFEASSEKVLNSLKLDETTSEALFIRIALETYQVLIYTGNLDLICPYPSVRNYLQKMLQYSDNEFKTAKRQLFQVGGETAGYITKGGNLTDVLIRNAGHLTSYDQPQWTLELMEKFTHGLL